jgi:hypothetical protein
MPQVVGTQNPQQSVDNPIDFRFGEAGGRIMYVDSATIEYATYVSNVLEVNGVNVQLGAIGDQTISCIDTDETINSSGVQTGLTPSNDTLYYAYVYNGADGSAPRLRLSLAVPQIYAGIKYLNSSGAGINWRYVGVVALTVGAFRDDLTARLIGNEYNKLPRPFFTCPGYNNNNADTTYNLVSSATWTSLNGGTADHVLLCVTGEEPVNIFGTVAVSLSAGSTWAIGVGCDTTLVLARATPIAAATVRNNQTNQASCVQTQYLPGEPNFLVASLNAWTNSTTPTIYADLARNGAPADPPATYLSGTVMV